MAKPRFFLRPVTYGQLVGNSELSSRFAENTAFSTNSDVKNIADNGRDRTLYKAAEQSYPLFNGSP